MNCEQVKAHLVDYLYGELSAEQVTELEAALDECPECAAELACMREVHELMAAVPRLDVPAQVHNNILREARLAADVHTAKTKRTGINWSALFSPPALATALVLAMVVGVGVMIERQGALPDQEPVPVASEQGRSRAEAPAESVVARAEPVEEAEAEPRGPAPPAEAPDDDGDAQPTPPLRGGVREQTVASEPADEAQRSLGLERADLDTENDDNAGRAGAGTSADEPTPDAVARLRLDETRERRSQADRAARDRDTESRSRRRQSGALEADRDDLAASGGGDADRRGEEEPPAEPRFAFDDDDDDSIDGEAIARAESAADPAPEEAYVVELEESAAAPGDAFGELVESESPEPTEWRGEQVLTLIGEEGEDEGGATVQQQEAQGPPQDEAVARVAPAAPAPTTTALPSLPAAGAAGGEVATGAVPDGTESGEADLEGLYARALSRYNDGSHREAVQYFDQLIQNAPRTSNFFDLGNYYQGQAQISMGNYREAAQNFEQIDDPGFEHYGESRLLLAQAYENSGQLAQAESLYNELLQSPDAATNLMADEGLERIQRRREAERQNARPDRSMREMNDGLDFEEAEEAEPAEAAEKPGPEAY